MALQSLPKTVGVFQNYVARGPETLVIKEKLLSLSGDSFDIKNTRGQPIFKVEGHAFSLSGRKELRDMQGNHLLTIRKHHLSIHRNYYAEDPSGNRFFELEGKFSLLHSKATGKFTNTLSGGEESLFMKGNFFDSQATITSHNVGEMPVAMIRRDRWNARELLGGQQTYGVEVAPGMDMAIIVAMVIMLDERENEQKG